MKRSFYRILPTGILWLCALVTLALSTWFFSVYFTQTLDTESYEISALLNWLFMLFFITVCTGLIFSIFYFIRQSKENPQKIRHAMAVILAGGLLFLIAWILGNGNPLPLIGYKGNENTYFWLKVTDMWLYSIYVLFGLGILAIFTGIIRSFFTKFK